MGFLNKVFIEITTIFILTYIDNYDFKVLMKKVNLLKYQMINISKILLKAIKSNHSILLKNFKIRNYILFD
ncbi:hypothetical protein BCO_0900071 (plasmid) [Borrelia coriaceae ATCC 43381]|uniref:Uncharacterized protein n=1 Tax=Borrelia coriaceae ATCC 43381 TaxID=1408429 RepID=W5SWG4_9SPIR|nr:hypothetical protein BCO_0900071 [Borrelia coriaceae ATCC 43381]